MWEILKDYLPNKLTFFCTILVFAIPYTIYKVNQSLHNYSDPAWKKDDDV